MFTSPDELQQRLRDAKHGIDPVSLAVVSLTARMRKQRLVEGPPAGGKSELAHAVAFVAGRRPTDVSIPNFEPELYPRLLHSRADSVGANLRFKSAELAAIPRFTRRGPGGLRG